MSTLQREGSPNFQARVTNKFISGARAHLAERWINHVIFDSEDSSTLR